MKTLTLAALVVLAAFLFLGPGPAPSPVPAPASGPPLALGDELFVEAERDYAEGSFSRANEVGRRY
jgi:hypothetical protein